MYSGRRSEDLERVEENARIARVHTHMSIALLAQPAVVGTNFTPVRDGSGCDSEGLQIEFRVQYPH
jgi:hypothetical protein